MSNLTQRIATAVVGIPLAFGLIFVGGLPLALFLGVLAGAGAWELYRIARASGVDALDPIGVVAAAAFPMVVHVTRLGWLDRPLAAAGVVFVAVIGIALFARTPTERPLESTAVTVLGALYAGATLAFGYSLRHHPWVVGDIPGTVLLLYPISVTWATDIGAYAFGRILGKRKLMPTVSPGKTLAGAYGGTALGIAVGVGYNVWILRPLSHVALPVAGALAFGLIIALVAQVGDLAESLFKREGGVKDSSNLIPGHGGVLDRLDSLYFALPVAYLLLGRLLVPVSG
ncbi:MAG: phosphatidate cytidylyltransferase [Gemmatimonadaceae bacterium]